MSAPYADRKTDIGSIREARRAGIKPAKPETRISTSIMIKKVAGSVGLTP